MVLYLVLNVVTSEHSPTVGMDGTIFTGPAINLVRGHGFTADGWNGGRFRTGNAPHYSLILILWLRVAPFGPAGIRPLNYLLAVSAGILIATAAP